MIEGRTVSLREPWPGDRERLFELVHDPDEVRFGMPAFVKRPANLDAIDDRIAEAAGHWAEREPGTLSIVDATDPTRFLGNVAWRRDLPWPFLVADIGYAVLPDARGRGVAREATRLLVRWLVRAEDGPGMARVQLDHSIENPASCRVALAAGLAQEGVRRGFLPLLDATAPGGVRRHDVCLHGIVAADVDA